MRSTTWSGDIFPLILFMAVDGDEIQLFAAATLTSPKEPSYPLHRRRCRDCIRRSWDCGKRKNLSSLGS